MDQRPQRRPTNYKLLSVIRYHLLYCNFCDNLYLIAGCQGESQLFPYLSLFKSRPDVDSGYAGRVHLPLMWTVGCWSSGVELVEWSWWSEADGVELVGWSWWDGGIKLRTEDSDIRFKTDLEIEYRVTISMGHTMDHPP